MKQTIDIAHHTEKHADILSRIDDYVRLSLEARTPDFARFSLHDRVADGFIAAPADEIEEQQNSSRPVYQSIVLPQSYAAMLSMLSYIATVFLSRTPILQFLGQTPEAQKHEMAVETLLHYQMRNSGSVPHLYQQLRDALQYGHGITGIAWDEDVHSIAALAEEQDIDTGRTKKVLTQKDVSTFIGNRCYVVHPTQFVHDPSVSLADFHSGEFAGEFRIVPRSRILAGFETGEYIAANKKRFIESNQTTGGYLWKYWGRSSAEGNPERPMANRYDDSLNNFYNHMHRGNPNYDKQYFIEVLDLYVKIIPKEWGLADSVKEQIWVFRIAGGEVLLQARPLGLLHNTFPYDVAPGDIDMYRLSPISAMERAIPFEHVSNWLLNSHFYNVRQHLANTMVVDPSRVMMMDLFNRSPAGVIRARPEAYGQDLRQSVFQLQVGDVTVQHLRDLNVIEQALNQTLGVNDNVLGQVHPGGRKTATEIRTSTSFATNRLKFLAEWISAVSYSRKAKIMLTNTQQFLNEEIAVRVLGMDKNDAGAFQTVSPEIIAAGYLYDTVDGTLPVDRLGQAQMFGAFMTQMLNVDQTLDASAMFQFLAQMMGFKALPAFRRVSVMSDQQFSQGVQSGQLAQPPGVVADPNAMPQGT